MGSPAAGNLFMAAALIAGVVSVITLVWGNRAGGKEGESAVGVGYIATYAVLGFVSAAILILLIAFMTEDFSFMYVAENHPTDVSGLAWLYRLSGVWAGREGSLLFWEWLLAMFAAWVAYRRRAEADPLSNVALATANAIQLFFLVALFIDTNNPFKVTPDHWLTAAGDLVPGLQAAMNPLLQHWAMILHPPTLFVGYAGLAIPFAFAVAAIITGDGSSRWVKLSDRITVFSWLFLGIGIGLGAIWAYVVLGWGGYWGWDPVENASLLPWLTGVGLLHSFTVYRRKDGFKVWAVVMSGVTFVLVLLGTFITRSGIVQSVHAFQQDPWSLYWFLSMMIGCLAVTFIGVWVRRAEFRGKDEFESLVSKDASYYFNNVLMLMASVLVAYWTLAPALPAFLPGGGREFGPATYDAVARPVGILYVFIMAVCPILSWKRTDPETFWKRAKWPLAGAGVLGAFLLWIWYSQLWPIHVVDNAGETPVGSLTHGWEAVVGLLVAAFAVAIPVYLFYEGARRRSAARGEGFVVALGRIMTKARTQSGGYLTHLGVGIILIGLVGSSMFVLDAPTFLANEPGASFEVQQYEFTFAGLQEAQMPNGDAESVAEFDVAKNGRVVKRITPSLYSHVVQGQTTRHVDIVYEPLRDVFFIYEGVDPDTNELVVDVKINPLISFVWVGFVLTILGTTLAVWPKRRAAA